MSQHLADDALREILKSQYDGEPLTITQAPPGAGKTGAIVDVAAQGALVLHQRNLIATPTYEQLRTIVARLATKYPRAPLTAWVPKDRVSDLGRELRGATRVVGDIRSVDPTERGIVIAVAAKWRWASTDIEPFDVLFVDEAFQVSAADYAQMAALARRHLLIGDPGQIDPIVTCDVDRWGDAADGPHLSAPEALLNAYNPRVISYPVSRRLPQDTVSMIGPLFYPGLAFVGLDSFPERALLGATINPILQRIVAGASIVGSELPAGSAGERDGGMVAHLISLARQMIEGNMQVRLNGETRALTSSDIGIVAPHVSQVAMLQQASPWPDVLIETANRFQGIERPIMLVWHPLSGRTNPQDFHLDVGRFCVMTSRHQVACIIAARGGIEEQLHANPPSGGRSLVGRPDRVFQGWHAQRALIQRLRADHRIFDAA